LSQRIVSSNHFTPPRVTIFLSQFATDFFTVKVWTVVGLVRYHVWFVIRLANRMVRIAGIGPETDRALDPTENPPPDRRLGRMLVRVSRSDQ